MTENPINTQHTGHTTSQLTFWLSRPTFVQRRRCHSCSSLVLLVGFQTFELMMLNPPRLPHQGPTGKPGLPGMPGADGPPVRPTLQFCFVF